VFKAQYLQKLKPDQKNLFRRHIQRFLSWRINRSVEDSEKSAETSKLFEQVGSTIRTIEKQFESGKLTLSKLTPVEYWLFYIEAKHRFDQLVKDIESCHAEYRRIRSELARQDRDGGREYENSEERKSHFDGVAIRKVQSNFLPSVPILAEAINTGYFTLRDVVLESRKSAAFARSVLADEFGYSEEEIADKLTDGDELIKAILQFNETGKRPDIKGKKGRVQLINQALDLFACGEFFPNVNLTLFSQDEVRQALTGYHSPMFVTTLGTIGASRFSNTFISIDDV
jgi:hypothetical protein